MQEGHYDIKKVKRYFRYYLFPNFSSFITDFEIEQFILKIKQGMFANIFMIILSIAFPLFVYVSYKSWDSILSLFMIFGFPAILITIPLSLEVFDNFIRLIQFNRYCALKDYIEYKNSLDLFLLDFKRALNRDLFTDGINVVTLGKIQNSMKIISKLLFFISGPLIEFRKLGSDLPREAQKTFEEFIRFEVEWLTEYIEEFRELLATWMEVHQAELTEFQKKNLESQNEKILSLASNRLSSHIENLEKVRAKI